MRNTTPNAVKSMMLFPIRLQNFLRMAASGKEINQTLFHGNKSHFFYGSLSFFAENHVDECLLLGSEVSGTY